jgi:hypothetical protein
VSDEREEDERKAGKALLDARAGAGEDAAGRVGGTELAPGACQRPHVIQRHFPARPFSRTSTISLSRKT